MKKFFLFVLLFVAVSQINAQDNPTLIKEQKKQVTKKVIIEDISGSEDKSLITEDIEEQIENSIQDFPHFSKECHNTNNNEFTNRAMLGVKVQNASGNNGASITEIIQGTGAQKAGLMEGDLILRLGKEKIMNTDELIASLASAVPGDKVKLKILRNGETISKEIVLAKPAFTQCKVICINKNIDKDHLIIEKIRQLDDLDNKEESGIQTETIILKDKSDNNLSNGKRSFSVNYLSGNPNPNSGVMSINFKGDKSPFTVRVIDLDGKELFKESVEDNSGVYKKEVTLDKVAGTILIQVKQGTDINTAKIIIQ